MNKPVNGTASFDVFDTLLVRPVLWPTDIFRLVELETGARGWLAARVRGERRARMRKQCREVSLAEIYAEIPSEQWGQRLPEYLALELAWERQTRLVPKAAAELIASRKAGRRIAFVSDMYLPEPFFREQLREVLQAGDALILSHAEQDSKGRTLWAKLSPRFARPWSHLGDNAVSDVSAARRHGIDGRLWTYSMPTERERCLYAPTREGILAAGLARLARNLAPATAHPAWSVGANVAGPVFHAFTRWVFAEAQKLGVDCVYFLSRDGELPFRLAAQLREREPGLPPVRYLLGSRHAWYNAVFDLRNERHRRWVRFAAAPTVRGVLGNLMVLPQELAEPLDRIGFHRSRWDEPLTERERLGVLERLARESDVTQWFDRRRVVKGRVLLDYFAQEGVLSHRAIALVDVGWSGSMADCLVDALAQVSGTPPSVTGLFFGLHAHPAHADARAFAFAPRWWNHWARQFPSVVEMLVPGTHGQVTEFVRDRAGIVCPVVHDRLIAPREIIASLHGGALMFSQLANEYRLAGFDWTVMLKNFLEQPTGEERRIMRAFRFETWQGPETDSGATLVPTLSTSRLLMRCFSPWRQVDAWPWPQASWLETYPRTPAIFLRALTWKLQTDLAAWILINRLCGAARRVAKHSLPMWGWRR